jgi:hypothetical protein
MKTMIVTDHLGFSEHNYEIFKDINSIVATSIEEVSVAVNDVSTKIMEVNTAVTNIAEIGCFQNGVLIATTLANASQILIAKTSSQKLLYLWDIDWMHSLFEYEWLYNTLTNDDLEIIVRSESHRDAVLNLCNREPLGVLRDFKLEKIWNLLENTKTK